MEYGYPTEEYLKFIHDSDISRTKPCADYCNMQQTYYITIQITNNDKLCLTICFHND